MSANFTPIQNEYTNLTPFKSWLLLQINTWGQVNFPFVESDFDELTNYGMMQKLMGALNDVISNENEVEQDMTNLFGAFTELQNYVNDYFDNLDVQDEINAKLDLMAEDGSLTNLIKNYVDPIYTNYTTQINNEIATINTKVDNAVSGSPLVASSTSGMTDTTRVYVNTTDGKWYYYDGDSWEIGGTYQSTGVGSDSVGYDELKPQLQEYFTNDIQVEIGSINVVGGVEVDNPKRVRTTGYYYSNGDFITLTDKRYISAITYYELDKTYKEQSGWNVYPTQRGTTPYYLRFIFKRVDEADMTYEDLKNISQAFTINGKKVINTENDIHHQYNGIEFNYLDKNTQDGIKYGLFSQGKSFENTPLFIKCSLYQGNIAINMTRDNKSTYDFLENEKITFTLKQGMQCKLANYNSDGTWVNDTSWTMANDSDISVSYNITGKGRIGLATIEDNTTGNYNLDDMATDFVHSPLSSNPYKYSNNNFMHFSFDDVSITFSHIATSRNVYSSIFEEPFMNYLKTLHETYGAKFSLYCNNINALNTIGDKFKNDFVANNDWLKIGYHSANGEHMSTLTTEQAKTNYDNFINYALTMAGLNSIDRIPRLDYFDATQNQVNALRDTTCGIYGLLTADDDRNQGYLSNAQKSYLYNNNNLFDTQHGLIYYSTNLRLDTFVSGFSSQYNYHTNTESNPYDELVARYSNPSYSNYNQDLIIFTHEWQLYSQSYQFNATMKNYIEQVMQFANEYGYVFDYVQNRVPNIKSLTI